MTKKTAILFHIKTWSYDCRVLTEVASLSMKEQVVNVPEPRMMNTAPPPHCSKDERETKERDRRIVDI